MASIPPPPKSARCLAVIPARNEGASVAEVVAGVRQALACDVLVIDDASSDDTRARAAEAGAITLRLPLGLGAWGATQTGIRYAFRHGYDSVIALDADGQHLPETLPTLFATQAAHGADVVIGTCVERLSRAKRVAWWYLRLLTGLRIADLTSGLRLYDRRAIELLAGPDASLLDYQDIGVLMLLARKGLRIEETPVPMRERRAGHSRVFASWPVVASYMAHTTVLCLSRLDAGRRSARSVRRAQSSC